MSVMDPLPTVGTRPRYISRKIMAFCAGMAVAVAAIALFVSYKQFGSFEGLFAGITLPAELSDSYFLYQHDGRNTLYHFEHGVYRPINLGTTLDVTAVSRRGTHVASIERGEGGMYGVRADAQLRYTSPTMKFSAAVSPSGTRVAYTEASQEELQAAFDANTARFPTRVFLIEDASEPELIGAGFSPFFRSDTKLAWWSAEGLVERDLTTGETIVLEANARPLPPPYPAPTVSRDGALVAWTEAETQAVHISLLTSNGLVPVETYAGVRSPYITLGAESLYITVPSKEGSAVFRHALRGDANGTRVYGFPQKGTLIQFAP